MYETVEFRYGFTACITTLSRLCKLRSVHCVFDDLRYPFTYSLPEGTGLEDMPSDRSAKTIHTRACAHAHTQFRVQSMDCREPMQSAD